jgi:23S rRNA pseudouridine2605 synthase
VQDLFPKGHERLFTVGRLDENSQGLLLVTNDGDLAHRMAHPRFEVEKTYRVQVAGIPSREIVEQLAEGMYFSEGRFAAKSARLLKSKGQSAVLEIVLTEGQYRRLAPQEVQQLEQLSQGGRRGGKRNSKPGSGRKKAGHSGKFDRQSQQPPRAGERGAGSRGKSRGDRRVPAPRRGPASGRRASAARGSRPAEAARPPQDEEVFITRRRSQPSAGPVDDIEKSLFGQRAGRDSEDELAGGGSEAKRPRPKRSQANATSPRRKPGGSARRREDDDLPEA